MTTLWQRGLQWCRKSKPKLEALRGAGVWRELVVRVDSPKESSRLISHIWPTHCTHRLIKLHILSTHTATHCTRQAKAPHSAARVAVVAGRRHHPLSPNCANACTPTPPARKAVELHRVHRAGAGAAGEGRDAAAAAARAERPAEEEEDGEEEDDDEEDTWLDRMLTRAALAALVAVVGAWGYMHLHIWANPNPNAPSAPALWSSTALRASSMFSGE